MMLFGSVAEKLSSLSDSNSSEYSVLYNYVRGTAFKRLLRQIDSAQRAEGVKTICVVSQQPGEGRSFLVSALAIGFATLLDKRVAVLDMVNQTSNRQLLVDRVSTQSLKAISADENSSRSIDVITSKSVNHDGSFDSTDFQIGSYLNSFKEAYDVVLIDTCSIESAIENNMDPVVLAGAADATLVLLSSASVAWEVLNSLKADLQRSGGKILGTVFNTWRKSDSRKGSK